MANLFLVRHAKSQWNQENRFSGWVDNPLSKEGREEIKKISRKLFGENFESVYTSPLIRNMETVLRIFDNLAGKYPLFFHFSGRMKKWAHFQGNGDYIPVFVAEELNERYYGKLQGKNKDKTKKEFGERQVWLWRRGYKEKPPGGESLEDTFKRTIPFFKKYVEKDLKENKNVLLVGSHNALRSIVKYIEKISDKDIINFEIDYGGIIKYELDKNLNLVKKEIIV